MEYMMRLKRFPLSNQPEKHLSFKFCHSIFPPHLG